ncbi:MAG: hypothetical protein AAGD43_04710 [Pseudomonadota bacterium]
MQNPAQPFIPQMQQPNPAASGTRFAKDFTDRDLSTHLSPVTSKGGLLVNFFYAKIRTRNREADNNGKIETRLCVSKQPIGDRSTVAVQYITEEDAARHFPQQFSMFKQYGDVPTTGTPLHELPGISMSQMGLMAINGIRSVEDLIGITEDMASQLGREVTAARNVALQWTERKNSAQDTIEAAEIKANMDIQMKTMAGEMEKLRAANTALAAQNEALKNVGGGVVAQTADQQTAVQIDNPNDDGDLPYNIDDMENPMIEGPDVAEGSSDLGLGDPDPLSEDA